MSGRDHAYTCCLTWDGNRGPGTAEYTGYGREYRVRIAGKPDLPGSADPVFRGDGARHNPEELFLASVSACHMLAYLALCARHGVRVLAYEDEARGVMRTEATGGGRFVEIVLYPEVLLAPHADRELALRLHDVAHERCFIANSCAVPIRHRAVARLVGAPSPEGAVP